MVRWLVRLFPLIAAGVCAVSCQQPPRPNIVLAMADDQGWGDVGYQGSPVLRTPHLDSMAASGLRFDRFYAAAPVCSPTRGSVLTGRHPNRFGCFSWGRTLRPQEVTLAEILQENGYATGHFGKWHLGSVRKGSPVNPGESGFEEWFSAENFFDLDPLLSRRGAAMAVSGDSSIVTVDAAIEFIRASASAERPFLAVVWFGSPHRPHRALEQDLEPYRGQPEALQHYYGEITAMDRAVGRLREELRGLGIAEDTILWYCSDNGALPEGSTGGFRGYKAEIYEGGLLVPSLLEWPGRIQSPMRSSVRANTSDILPTILDLLELPPPHERILDGTSLVPLIDGRMTVRERAMGFWQYPRPGVPTPSQAWMEELLAAQQAGREPEDPWKLRLDAGEIRERYPLDVLPGHAAWIDGDWKLHRIADAAGSDVRLELYDLGADPAETRDLSTSEPGRAEELRVALEAWQHSVIRSLNGEEYGGEPGPGQPQAGSDSN